MDPDGTWQGARLAGLSVYIPSAALEGIEIDVAVASHAIYRCFGAATVRRNLLGVAQAASPEC
jgi:hypothetical protein